MLVKENWFHILSILRFPELYTNRVNLSKYRDGAHAIVSLVKKEIGKTFSERVVELALMISRGRVATYGALARAAGGGTIAAQSVTTILGKAYEAGETRIPFHRIVYSGGRVWLDDAHRAKRLQLYKAENIALDTKDRILHFDDIVYEFR